MADHDNPETPWTRDRAVAVIEREGLVATDILADIEQSLRPVTDVWLDRRLNLMWKSSTPAHSLDATAWLHETIRLLRDLPGVVLREAIDLAIQGSLKGFMPTVGEIRAIAVPMRAELEQQRDRMRVVIHGVLARPRYSWEREERNIAPEDLCSPDEAAAILRKFGFGSIQDEKRKQA